MTFGWNRPSRFEDWEGGSLIIFWRSYFGDILAIVFWRPGIGEIEFVGRIAVTWEHLGNIQGSFRGTFMEHLGFRQRRLRVHLGFIQGTFREHSGFIQGAFREHLGNI